MGWRPSDKHIDQESREAEKHHDAAQRALAIEAVKKWNALMKKERATAQARMVTDGRSGDRRSVLLP